jgi:hypothetical protein
VIVAVWAVILVAAATMLLTADWYVSCSDEQGNHLGGMDCFRYRTLPTSHTEPAASIGFLPLAVLCVIALVMVVGIPLSTAMRANRESITD